MRPVEQPAQAAFPLQELEGILERITYQNDENGYTVARLVSRGISGEVSIVGPLAGANVGESIHLYGHWTNHPQFGRQFEIRSFTVQYPSTIEGLRKYLGSGMIRGIGPATASRIVDHFGLETLEIIEDAPQRMKEVPGIGEYRTQRIMDAWQEQKQIKEIMLFLQGHGVSTGLAVKIYKQYGDDSISVVRLDPYRLAKDIYGIGFKTADKIARQLGLAADAPARIQAGLIFALSTLSDEGHCFALRSQLIAEAARLLEINAEACLPQLKQLILDQSVIDFQDGIYLPPFYMAEQGTATRLLSILHSSRNRLSSFLSTDWEQSFAWLNLQSDIQLTDQQRIAIRMALTSKVSVLTGGPGTGKSTIMASLIQLLKSNQGSVLLAAPTGRAAKRLSETTGVEARTIHRLLEFSPNATRTFLRDKDNPLDSDLIIIDEASMVDILLINHLLAAIEVGSHLLLVGDIDQLPSVGPGNVLKDIINSGVVPVTRLDTIFRQAANSHIITNAHRINQGEMPVFPKDARDFFLFPDQEPEKAADWVIDLVKNRIPSRFGLNPMEDIQVLSPMHRGAAGVSELNQRLQSSLNPPIPGKAELHRGGMIFRENDRVMQTRNDYERQVFNGDLGTIKRIDTEDQFILVDFDGHQVECDYAQLDELMHAYAISIHKSQGSEFPAVIIPILTQQYRMLQRNLLYTGITRARKLVVLVGSKKAIYIAIQNDRIASRNTKLAERLKNPPPSGLLPGMDFQL